MSHHPADALLMLLAGGQLSAGATVVVAAHVEGCAVCQRRQREFEAVGGALLEQLEPTPLSPTALARTLARIDAHDPLPASSPDIAATARLRAALPAGVSWPRSLHHSSATRWRPVGPGLRWSRVTLANDRSANVYLLRVAPGKSLPMHSHSGREHTYVLYGAFEEGRDRYAAGDLEEAGKRAHHQPIAAEGSECICLTSVDGRVAFEGPIAKVMGSLLGL
jgi:putative transcriptional regulator